MEAGNSEPYAPCTIPGHPFGGWRHHLSPYSGGTMGTGHFGQFVFMEVTVEKPYNRASPVGNAPLLTPAAPLPSEGEVLVAICNE